MAHHDNPGHVGIRTKTHKIIYYYGCKYDGSYRTPPAWEVYDLKKDPFETVNVYDNPEYAGVVKDLKKRLATTRDRIGDNGRDHPACEAGIQEYRHYDEADRARAAEISHQFLQTRLAELKKRKQPKKKPRKKK